MSDSGFKVGDRVRVRQDSPYRPGEAGVLVHVTQGPGPALDHHVKLSDGHSTWFASSDLSHFPEPDETSTKRSTSDAFEAHLDSILAEIKNVMVTRHQKYGAGNIAKHGVTGIRVRLDDKFSRLDNGSENYDDETVVDTLNDVIGYSIIWRMWIDGSWPGSSQELAK